MDNPRTTASGDDLTMNMENPLGPFNTYGGQNRRDTVSTVSSEKHSPMPTGVWSLTLHGNCSRCHHHHKSAVVQFKIFDNPSEGSDVHCEHCKHKWLTIGGINTTQISLLSTRTTAVGSEEIDLRYRLNSIIRSATAIASPVALASVPEVLPNLPSRGHSQRMPSHEPESNTHANGKNKNRHDAELPTNLPIDQSNSTPSWSHRQRPQEPKPRWTKDFLRSLKRKLRDALPVLKGIHFRDLLDTPRKFKLASKTEGKRSVADEDHQVTKEVHDDAGKAHSQDGHSQEHDTKAIKSEKDFMVPTYQVTDSEEFDNETIKNLSPQQRRAWFRAQITDVKLRYNHRRCSCRHSTSSYMIDGSRQIYRSFSPSVPFRHSLEGLGSHFDQFPPESMSPRSGSLAISNSGTRTSEADTAVETQTIISSTRTSMLDTVQYPRHRSSPRPTSLANSRLQQEFPHRDSVDSIVTRDAPLTRASRRGIDRRSLGSFTHVAFQSSRTNLGNADTIG